jgi:pimeloyl-ACP methyl ester carboxylesterase
MGKKNNSANQGIQVPMPIIYTAKILETFAPKIATRFAARLFTTPIKHKIPKREFHMEKASSQKVVHIPSINKDILVYHYGKSDPKILLVHGWSGRGTQLVKIADMLLEQGYSTVSFDAPAHGKSKGSTTLMIEFIESIMELEKQYGTFEYAIGHSLGGMAVLNAVKQNLQLKKAVIIGSGDIIQDIVDEFVSKLKMKPKMGTYLQKHFEKRYGQPMNNFSGYIAAKDISIPVLIIHDEDDVDVPLKAAQNIHDHLINSELMITKGLGHRKILGDEKVIQKIKEYIIE